MKSKVLVYSIAFGGYDRFFRRCIETHQAYSKKQGYEYVLVNRSPYDLKPDEAAWLKIPLFVRALENGYDWVFFVDADCELRSHTPRLESLQVEEKSIYLVPGASGQINSGIMIAQNLPQARAFFRTILENVDNPEVPDDLCYYENGHVIYYGTNNPSVHLLDHYYWNNNSSIDENSYIQHYSSGRLRPIYIDSLVSPLDWLIFRALSKVNKMKRSFGSSQCKNDELLPRLATYMKFFETYYQPFHPSSTRKVKTKTA